MPGTGMSRSSASGSSRSAGGDRELAHGRHRLQPHRAARVVGVHQRRVVRRDAHVELGVGLDDRAALVVVRWITFSSWSSAGDALPLLPVPVVPLGVSGTSFQIERAPGGKRDRTLATGRMSSSRAGAAATRTSPMARSGLGAAPPSTPSNTGRFAICRSLREGPFARAPCPLTPAPHVDTFRRSSGRGMGRLPGGRAERGGRVAPCRGRRLTGAAQAGSFRAPRVWTCLAHI